jgi:hypothetical protein
MSKKQFNPKAYVFFKKIKNAYLKAYKELEINKNSQQP